MISAHAQAGCCPVRLQNLQLWFYRTSGPVLPSQSLLLPGMSAVGVLRSPRVLRQLLPGLLASMSRHYSLDVPAPLLRTQGYVDGSWISAASVFPVLDPATGQELARVSDCGPAEAQQAVEAAHRAFQTWRGTPAKVGGGWRVPPNSVQKPQHFTYRLNRFRSVQFYELLHDLCDLFIKTVYFGYSTKHGSASCHLESHL